MTTPTTSTNPEQPDEEMREATMREVMSGPPTKRMLVTIDGIEIPDPKRIRADPDVALKTDALVCLLHWHEYMAILYKLDDPSRIDSVADITSILWTAHTRFRHEANGNGSLLSKITSTTTFNVGTNISQWEVFSGPLKEIAKAYNFKYQTTEEGRNRTGTLGSLLALFNAYRPRFNEVRVGTTKITMEKSQSLVKETPISSFGLGQEHAILTAGSTFNPTIQSSMKQALGPMTIAINLCMQNERVYQQAWKKAFIQAFKLFPGVNEIANLLAGSGRDHDGILRLLADISLWGAARTSNKAFFPFAMVMVVARSNTAYSRFVGGTLPTNNFIAPALVHQSIISIDFSGAGAYRFWGEAAKKEYKIRASNEMSQRTMREVVFHATWGTAKDDLSLVEWMTNHRFQTRKEIGKQLVGKGLGRDDRTFSLIPFIRVCKLASASATDFLTGGRGQVSRGVVFSGKCTQRVDIDGELFKTLMEAKDETRDRMTERAQVIAKLNRTKEAISKRVLSDPIVRFGTTEFYEFDPATGYGEASSQIPPLVGRFFYGIDD